MVWASLGTLWLLQEPLSAEVLMFNEDVLLDLMRLYHVSLALSLIPTPILIFVYFKPVRMKLRKCVLRVCGKWRRSRLLPSKQDPMTVIDVSSTSCE